MSRSVKRETKKPDQNRAGTNQNPTGIHQESLRTYQEPTRNLSEHTSKLTRFWLIPGGFLVDCDWFMVGSGCLTFDHWQVIATFLLPTFIIFLTKANDEKYFLIQSVPFAMQYLITCINEIICFYSTVYLDMSVFNFFLNHSLPIFCIQLYITYQDKCSAPKLSTRDYTTMKWKHIFKA